MRSLLLLFRWGRIRTYLVLRGLSGERGASVDRWLNPRRGNAGPAVEMDSERKGANLGEVRRMQRTAETATMAFICGRLSLVPQNTHRLCKATCPPFSKQLRHLAMASMILALVGQPTNLITCMDIYI